MGKHVVAFAQTDFDHALPFLHAFPRIKEGGVVDVRIVGEEPSGLVGFVVAPREDEDASVRRHGGHAVVIRTIHPGDGLGRAAGDGHLVQVGVAEIGVGILGSIALDGTGEVEGVGETEGRKGGTDAWGLDGVQYESRRVPSFILSEDGTPAEGRGDIVARIPLAHGVEQSLGLGIFSRLEQDGSIADAVIVSSIRQGDQHRIGRCSFLVLVHEGVGVGQLAVGLDLRVALDRLAEVVDGVLIPQFVVGGLAFFEVEGGAAGDKTGQNQHPGEEGQRWNSKHGVTLRNNGVNAWP